MTKEEKKEEKTTKLSKNVEGLVETISKLTVMELSELVNALQDKLGVTAMPVAAAAPVAAGALDAAATAGASDGAGGGTVVITAVGDKIAAIKAIRDVDQNISIGDAKAMTENLPAEVLKDAKPDDAKSAVEKLKAAGATVEIK